MLRLVGALAVGLRDAPVASIRLTDEEGEIHREHVALQAVLPQIGHIVPLLSEEAVSQHMPELVGR